MPSGALFVGMSDLQKARFIEWPAKKLKTDRKFAAARRIKSARDADPADSGQVGCDSENISQIHLEGILFPFAESECCCRRCR